MKDAWSSLLKDDLDRLFTKGTDAKRFARSLEEGERRDIAALFLDFRGYTELSEKIDHESVHLLTGSIMRALAAVVEQHEGYVDKFEGDRLMALFGAKGATDNDSVRAVACGLRMRDTMEEINRSLEGKDLRITVGIGIASGKATVGPDPSGHVTATGSCVNMASRLEEAAPGNAVYVSEGVVRRCESNFEWDRIGELELKGFESSVQVFTPTGPGKAQRERWNRTALLETSSLVGRDTEMLELERLRGLQDDLMERNRRGGAVHILAGLAGEGGIGKSRLLHEFLKKGTGHGDHLVLKGSTAPFAQSPMTLFTSILRNFFDIRAGDPNGPSRLRSILNDLAGSDCSGSSELLAGSENYLASLLNIDRETGLPEQESEKRFGETLLALRNLLLVLSRRYGKLILALEDLHWIDPSSSKALSFVLGNCDTKRPLLVICTYRPGGSWEMPPEGDALRNYLRVFQFGLSGLSEDCCSALLSSITGGRVLPAECMDFILQRSQGNPFYLEELFMLSVESGSLNLDENEVQVVADLNSLPVPSSISGLVQHRVDRLPSDLRRVLQAASVLGPEFSATLFENYLRGLLPGGEPIRFLHELVRMKMLTRDSGGSEETYRFNHIMTRNAAYDTLLLYNRRIMHRDAAEAIMETYEGNPEPFYSVISHHYEKGDRLDEAYGWGKKALELARKNYQLDEVLEWSSRLLDWLEDGALGGDPREIMDLMMKRQQALNRTGRRTEQEALLGKMVKLASEGGLSDWEASARNFLGVLYRLTGRFTEAMEELRKAREISGELPDRDIEIASITSMALLHLTRNELDSAQECLEEALQLAMDSEDRRNEAYILGNLGILYRRKGKLDAAFDYHTRALDTFQDIEDLRNVGANLTSLGILHFNQGSRDKAEEHFRCSLEISRKVGDRWFESKALANLGIFYRDTGVSEKVEEYLLPALEIAVMNGERSQECGILTSLAEFHLEDRDRSSALDYAERALVLSRELGDRRREGHLVLLKGELQLMDGRASEAHGLFQEAGSISEEIGNIREERLSIILKGIASIRLGRDGEGTRCLQRARSLSTDSLPPGEKESRYAQMLMSLINEKS